MKNRLGIALIAASLAGCGVMPRSGPQAATGDTLGAQGARPDALVPGEIIVGARPQDGRLALGGIALLGGELQATFTLTNTHYVVKVPRGTTTDQALAKARSLPGVAYAVPNRVFKVSLPAPDQTASDALEALEALNDPFFGQQWAFKRTGTPANWERIDATRTLVAVADTGVDDRHPDFGGRVRRGKNFANGTDDTMDRYGHGTHVAGITAATGNNGIGMAGVVWNAPILAIKVLGDNGSGTTQGVAEGMKYAADQGAKVLNMSLGSDTSEIDPVMHDALQYCLNRGTIVICAAGNSSGAIGSPANDPLAVAVTSTSNYPIIGEKISYFSSRGPNSWVAAPGDGIMSTLPSGGSNMGTNYGKASGTSMACPFVAGTATAMRALHPDWSADQVRAKLKDSVDDLGAKGRDNNYGWGRVNLARAAN
ncbi:MAG: S8 family serine peptidase [Candidatus Sericytochromatia bacterium]|nr:S8 family serine peptidase [Candidatus Tanganyikabacteria bacterium]